MWAEEKYEGGQGEPVPPLTIAGLGKRQTAGEATRDSAGQEQEGERRSK